MAKCGGKTGEPGYHLDIGLATTLDHDLKGKAGTE